MDEHQTLIKLLDRLTAPRQPSLDVIARQHVKNICKDSPVLILPAADYLLERLKAPHSQTRLLALEVINDLFTRSKVCDLYVCGDVLDVKDVCWGDCMQQQNTHNANTTHMGLHMTNPPIHNHNHNHHNRHFDKPLLTNLYVYWSSPWDFDRDSHCHPPQMPHPISVTGPSKLWSIGGSTMVATTSSWSLGMAT